MQGNLGSTEDGARTTQKPVKGRAPGCMAKAGGEITWRYLGFQHWEIFYVNHTCISSFWLRPRRKG